MLNDGIWRAFKEQKFRPTVNLLISPHKEESVPGEVHLFRGLRAIRLPGTLLSQTPSPTRVVTPFQWKLVSGQVRGDI